MRSAVVLERKYFVKLVEFAIILNEEKSRCYDI